jgi:hypothetical protein
MIGMGVSADPVSAQSGDLGGGAWVPKSSMNYLRFGLGATAVNGKIYVIGGLFILEQAVANVEEYDPVADSWTIRRGDATSAMGLGCDHSQ